MVNHANYADLVLTPSEHFRKKLIHYGVKKDIEVLPNGFADKHFPVDPAVKTLNNGEMLKIIWHSRVSGEKRIMPFLRALKMMNGKYRLDVYGNGGDLLKAKQFAKVNRLNTKFYGDKPFDEVQKAISKAHLDVLVSYNFDTFGMTLIEAEAHGVPVFFCDPDMQEIVPKGSYVLSISENTEDMAKALNDLLAHPARIQQMSETMLKNREQILISNRIKKLLEIFDKIRS